MDIYNSFGSVPNITNFLLSMRNQLNISLDEQTELSAIGKIIDGQAVDFSVSTLLPSLGQRFSMEADSLTEEVRIQIRDFSNNVLYDTTSAVDEVDASMTILDETLASYIQNMINQRDINDCICELNNKFLCNVKVPLNDCISYLNTYSEVMPEDVNSIKRVLISAAQDGYITKDIWAAYLKELCTESKESADNDFAQLDTSNPFLIVSFANIMKMVFDVVAPVLISALSLALNGVLRVIGLFASGVIQGISSLDEAMFKYTFDDAQPLKHLSGPIMAIPAQAISSGGYDWEFRMPDEAKYQTIMLQRLGLNVFLWSKDGSWSDESPLTANPFVNAYININTDYDVLKFAMNAAGFSCIFGGDLSVTLSVPSFSKIMDETLTNLNSEDFVLTDNQISQILFSETRLRKTIVASYLAALYPLLGSSDYNQTWSVSSQFAMMKSMNYVKTGDTTRVWQRAFLSLLANCIDNSGQIDFSLPTDDYLRDLHSFLISYGTSLDLFFTFCNDGKTSDGQYIHDMYYSPLTCLFSRQAGYPNTLQLLGDYSLIDQPVPSPYVTLPQFNKGVVLALAAVVASAVAALVISTKVMMKKLRLRTDLKKKSAAILYKEAYDAAVANPTDANIKAYKKEKLNYNIKSFLYRWDTYDPSNNWFEARDNASAIVSEGGLKVANQAIDAIHQATSSDNDNYSALMRVIVGDDEV